MDLNADFSKRAIVHSAAIPWEGSEMRGVERRRLDRIRSEQPNEAVTTVVRYAAGSHFSPHVHSGGEEFVVLDGVFQDEHGDYPAGTYVRNPPTSSHKPGSESGCTILVKLWQFDPDDRQAVSETIDESAAVADEHQAGVRRQRLHEDRNESVSIEYWEPETTVAVDATDGAELFVLTGSCKEGGDELTEQSWLRLPPGGQVALRSGPDGTVVWIKRRHLSYLIDTLV